MGDPEVGERRLDGAGRRRPTMSRGQSIALGVLALLSAIICVVVAVVTGERNTVLGIAFFLTLPIAYVRLVVRTWHKR